MDQLSLFLESLYSCGIRYYMGLEIAPVYEVRGYDDACDICQDLFYREGRYDVLSDLGLVPPFHANCRCWLSISGYCLIPHAT